MLRQTIERLDGLVSPERIWVITNAEQTDAVREICPEIPEGQIVAEPVGRDTAPAVALAALLVDISMGDSAFAMLPADHVIHDEASFRHDLEAAFSSAEDQPVIATVGIQPTFAATGYGYIKTYGGEKNGVFLVDQFVEKPNKETAGTYLKDDRYFWNGGIFVWRPSTILAAIEKYCPELHDSLRRIRSALSSNESLSTVLPREYPRLTKISIDYAVMEKADNVVMVRSSFDWDDVGSWPAIERHYDADQDENVTEGSVVMEDSKNNLLLSTEEHLVGVIGIEGLMVVHTPDATLICPKDRAQDVKQLVKKITSLPNGKDYL